MLESLLVQLESNDPTLKKLDLRGQKIKLETLQRIAKGLEQNTHLETLDLGENNIDASGGEVLAKSLEKNKGLKALFIDDNAIGDRGVKAFAKMLKINTSLTCFYVATNHIGKEGMQALAKALIGNSTLINLTISHNAIGDDGAQALAKALEKNTNLEHLYLAYNGIGEAGERALTISLEKNTSVTILNIAWHNNCEHCKNRFKYVERNEKLKEQNPSTIPELPSSTINITINNNEIHEPESPDAPQIVLNTISSPRNQFTEKVSSNFAEASTLVAKHEDVSVLKAEKSTHFPWGKLALLLLVLGLGGVIGLSVAGLFFWIAIPTVVFLIGAGIGIKALYGTHQQRQLAYQKRLLTPDNKPDTFMGQNEDQLLLSENQVENSYQTRKIKAEEASVKLTEILKNKGLDFKKTEATINVLDYDNGDFYLTYESLLNVLTITVALNEECKAEFQKGWELVEALVIDNPSQRTPPYENCIVIEVDTILNMDSVIHAEKLSSSEILSQNGPQIKIAEIDSPHLNVNSSSVFSKAREYTPKLPDNFCYSINLMWINSEKDEMGEYVCCRKNREAMNYELNQLRKWCVANPEAEINFWYDSACTNKQAIENTKNLLATLSSELNTQINLKDIREIPFVIDNSNLFQTTIAVYFRIDLLKLIICLFCMENYRHHSAIFSDWSIGDKVDQVLSKHQLYSEAMLKKLEEFGLLVGSDGGGAENQFLQMINTPLLFKSVKHAINCSLLLTVNTLNAGLHSDKDKRNTLLRNLVGVPYNATMTYVHLYFLLLRDSKTIKIRADIVNEGNNDEWQDYEPERHGYLMFGNVFNGRMHYGMHKKAEEADWICLGETIRFDNCYGFKPESAYCNVPYDAVRKDLSPGHQGRNHEGSFENAQPTNGKEFQCIFWPLAPNNSLTYVST